MFLRGLNYSERNRLRNDGMEDPEGKGRSAGDFQADELKAHDHANGQFNQVLRTSAPGADATAHGTDATRGEPQLDKSAPMEKGKGLETRPRNTAVYYYVKIN